MKTFLQRLFAAKKFPAPVLARAQAEGILLLDDGLRGSTTYRDFHAPGTHSLLRRVGFNASIVLTKVRLLAMQHSAMGRSSPIIDVPLTDQRIHKLSVSPEQSGVLLVAFDAGVFHDDWSGTIEYRFRTPQAQRFADELRELILIAASKR